MRAVTSFAALLSAVLAAACGGHEAAPRSASRRSLLDSPRPTPAEFQTPSVYVYHPREAAPLGVRITLPDGSAVLAGQRGERWLVPAGAKTAVPAAEVAPEDLILAQRKEGTFLFLGRSGTTYESVDALGPFVRSSTPLEPLVRVSAAGSVLVGVRRDAGLVRSDTGGASWSRVGPEGVRFQDVALRPDGKGLALAVPEALFTTSDFGATFSPANLAPAGADELVVDDGAALVVSTALGYRVWDPERGASLLPLERPLSPRTQPLGAAVPLGPSAAALAEGRAVLVGDQWIEIRPGPEAGSFSLVSGRFGTPLARAPFPLGHRCSEVRLAGTGAALYAACIRQKTPLVTQPIELHRSTDLGRTWKAEPYVVEGRSSELELATTGSGELVVSGVCPAALRGPGCRPMGIHVRSSVVTDAGAPATTLAPAATPSLAGTPFSLVASEDGRTLYALGRRSKSDALSVFVSHDAGASFDGRDVESIKLPEDDGRVRNPNDFVVESAAAAEDGTVSFVLQRGGRRSWLVVDDDGRALAVSRPPAENARLGAAGQRGFAVTPQGLEAWESLDGGATFTPLGKLPIDPCPGAGDCTPRVVCVAMGCVLSDVVTRIGWRAAPRASLLPPPAARPAPKQESKVGVPYVCALDAGEWKKVPGAIGPPYAEQATIGGLAWFVLRHDPFAASVSVVQARLGRGAGTEEVSLLPRAKKPAEVAYTASIQIEGAAALRYRIPDDPRDSNVRAVDVAWEDALFGHVGHATIPDAGPIRVGDFSEKGSLRLAAPALLSIARGGVYVRLHSPTIPTQPTYFVDGHAVEVVPDVVWGDTGRGHFHAEVARIGRASVPLRIDGATVVRAAPHERGWSFSAASLGLSEANAKRFDVTQHTAIAYAGQDSGIVVEAVTGSRAEAFLRPFRAEGPLFDAPIAVPTQRDLPTSPRPCSAADRAGTPRIIAAYQDGTRHPVVVTDPIEPMRVLLTSDAVLHGTPEVPCAAAFEAGLVYSEAASLGQSEQGIVLVDSAEHSYLFRTVQGPRDATAGVEWRSMTCRADPTADVPREVWSEKGTHVEAP